MTTYRGTDPVPPPVKEAVHVGGFTFAPDQMSPNWWQMMMHPWRYNQAWQQFTAGKHEQSQQADRDVREYFDLLGTRIRELTTNCRPSFTASHFKGGVGKTPFICNAASELQVSSGRMVVVIDHNQMWGTTARQLGLKDAPSMTTREAFGLSQDGGLQNAGDFSSRLATSKCGVGLLASDRVVNRNEPYGYETAAGNIQQTRNHTQVVFNDTGNDGASPAMAGVLENTTVLAVTVSPDEDGIDIARSLYECYTNWGHDELVRNAVTVIMGVKPGEELERYRAKLGLDDQAILLGIPYDQRAVDRLPTDLDETDIYVRIAYRETVVAALMVQHAVNGRDGFDEAIRTIRSGHLVALPSGRTPVLPWNK